MSTSYGQDKSGYATIWYERDDLALPKGRRRFRVLARLTSDGKPVGRLLRSRLVDAAALDGWKNKEALNNAADSLVDFFIRLGSPNEDVAFVAAHNVLLQASKQRREIGL